MRSLVSLAVTAVLLLLACALAPRAAFSHAQATTTVQFDREIVRILDNRCVMCHTENGLAFPLVTYEQTYAARWKIRQSALDRHMPPWAAVPGYGDFANDNALTQREIDFLVSWAESYGPRNNGEVYTAIAAPSASKPVAARTDFGTWTQGKPDLLVPLITTERARVVVDPKLKSERWLRGLEYQPGNRSAVRSVSFTIQESGQWIGSWTPWYGVVALPDTLAFRLPAGSHLVADIHYAKGAAPDQGSLGLYFSKQPSARTVSNFTLDPKPVSGKRVSTMKLDGDTNLLALQPTIGPGVQSIEVSARTPAGATKVLLFAKDIPLDWPTPYVYRAPVSLPKGTELSVVEHATGEAALPVIFSAYEGAPLFPTEQRKAPPPLSTRRFELSGTVKSIDAANARLVVQHGEIPGLMGAMTMSYAASPRDSLKNVAPGDQIHAEIVVSESGSHLENIEVTQHQR